MFEKQPSGISCIAWLDWTAGNFISANSKTSMVKVWNASQKHPLDTLRIGPWGITSLHFAAGTNRMVCSTTSGAVHIYNMLKREMEFSTAAAHTDTVFGSAFSPVNENSLLTCSYDGTMKLWNAINLSLESTIEGTNGIVYCCDWSPDGTMIVGSFYSGSIVIYDVASTRELARYEHHTKPSYVVAWNSKQSNYILTTSSDGFAAVLDINIADIKSSSGATTGSRKVALKLTKKSSAPCNSLKLFQHPAPVFGGCWNEDDSCFFATGCQDGLVRVFHYQKTNCPVYVLNGHTERSFYCSWSPLLSGILASGSDDRTIIVWKVDIKQVDTASTQPIDRQLCRRLYGHTANVRALMWSHEYRQILISGSWDSTIRVWNASRATCIHVVSDHVADIYSIASHPLRPFTCVSCSRDGTIRLWEMESLSLRMRYQTILEESLENFVDKSLDMCDTFKFGNPDNLFLGNFPKGIEPVSPLVTDVKYSELETLIYGKGNRELHHSLERDAPTGSMSSMLNSYTTDDKDSIHRSIALAEKYKRIFNFFCGANGSLNVWDCVIARLVEISKKSSSPILKETFSRELEYEDITKSTVGMPNMYSVDSSSSLLQRSGYALPENILLQWAKHQALCAETIPVSNRRADMSTKTESQLRRAAFLHAQVGDFQKYCEIMIDIDDWVSALAMAPSVSREYWKMLALKYALYMKSKESDECVPYFLGCGRDNEAISFFLNRKDGTSAMIVAKMSQERKDLIPDLSVESGFDNLLNSLLSPDGYEMRRKTSIGGGSRSRSNSAAHSLLEHVSDCRDRTETESENSRKLVRDVCMHLVEMNITTGKSITAVAQLIAIGEVEAATSLLSLCGEYDMAYAVSKCFGLDVQDHLVRMSERVGFMRDFKLASSILSKLPSTCNSLTKFHMELMQTRCYMHFNIYHDSFLIFSFIGTIAT